MQGPLLYLLLIVAVLIIVQIVGVNNGDKVEELSFTELIQRVENDEIQAVMTVENTLYALKKDSKIPMDRFGERYDIVCTLVSAEQFYNEVNVIYAARLGKEPDQVKVSDYGFQIQVRNPAGTPWWMEWLPLLIMMVLFVVFWMFIMRQQSGGSKGMMNFSRSRARMNDPSRKKVTFEDVAGAEEEKEELKEVVEFLKDPRRFHEVGARIPKGVLLVGPPGTGKTLLARAVSGEAGVPFFSISGSDFVEMFVGVGASRVRDLFDQAKKHAPAIVFIDEIDAVGRQRGAGLGGGHDEREQTLNQLLVEMDGFAANEGVIVMAATNRSDVLDPALLRPGRFDRQVLVNYPDMKGREEILKVHSRGKPLAADVDLGVIARRTPYFTGADLENVMNESAILTARAHKKVIDMSTVEEAITRVSAGPEKKSHRVSEQDKRLVAYHEAGHAIVAYHIPECDKVHEISIIPRGMAGGYTMFLPDEEQRFVSSAKLKAEMCDLLGGHCAEKLILGDVSTGSTSDLKRATGIARGMVTEYGMNDTLGPIFLGGEHEVFLGRDFSQPQSNLSEEVTAAVDREVRGLLESSYARSMEILKENIDALKQVANRLLEVEKIDQAEFERLMAGTNSEAETSAVTEENEIEQ